MTTTEYKWEQRNPNWFEIFSDGMRVIYVGCPGVLLGDRGGFKLGDELEVRGNPYQEKSYGEHGGGWCYVAKNTTNIVGVYVDEIVPVEPYYHLLYPGDKVRVLTKKRGLTEGSEHIVTSVDPKYKNGERGGLITLKGYTGRYWRDGFEYIEIPCPYKPGDKVLFTDQGLEKYPNHASKYTFYVIGDCIKTSSPSRWSFSLIHGNTKRVNFSKITETDIKPCPDDWVPPKFEVDLDSLTLAQVYLHEVPFGSCCGFRGIYGFSGLGQPLKDKNDRPIPNVTVTEEMITAAIKNFCRTRVTGSGMSMAILATTQIKLYEKCLLDAGFVKNREYPNYNHGATHMNAQYSWYAVDYRTQKQERMFG